MAESEGFEPPIPVKVCRFSRPVPSTTRPTLRGGYYQYYIISVGFQSMNGVRQRRRRPDGTSRTSLLLHASLRDADIIAGAVLDHVHHFVGLADYVVRSFGVMRVGGEAHGGAHVQVQGFFFAKCAGAQTVAQTAGYDQSSVFASLR